MNQTETCGLSQWEKQDRILMEDFNADHAKIDAALAAQGEALAPITEQIDKLGNCQLYTTTYAGNNHSSKPTVTFPGKPIVVMVSSQDGYYQLLCWQGMVKAYLINFDSYALDLSWNGNTASWYYSGNVEASLNKTGTTYQVIALLDMSAE